MKTTILTFLLLLTSTSFSQQVLMRTNTAGTTNRSWQIYRQNSPTNVYGNSHVLFEVNYDSTYLKTSFVKVDILDNRTGYLPGKKFISANNAGLLTQGSFDSLTFPISQIINLNTMLMDRPTLADGSLLYRPISYVPTYTDIITGLGYAPLSDEMDGSVTNELELPNQSGQNGKVLGTNGTSATWVALNTGTVTSIGIGSTTLTLGGTNPVTGSGTITVNLPNTGTAGTYGLVTTDAQGRVISGKRTETYSGITSGSGTYTVTFSTAYSSAPNIQANIINGTDSQNIRITSISTTGFTVTVRNRTDVVGLLPSWSNVSGASVDVLITEK